MNHLCPVCGSGMKTISERVRVDGVFVVSLRCRKSNCRKNITIYPNETGPVHKQGHQRMLSDEQVMEILQSDRPHTHLAADHGCSAATIRDVRIGRRYANVCPDLPRRTEWVGPRRFCADCIHHLGGKCSMGFPEARRPSYAQICSIYEQKERTVDFRMEVKPKYAMEAHELSPV